MGWQDYLNRNARWARSGVSVILHLAPLISIHKTIIAFSEAEAQTHVIDAAIIPTSWNTRVSGAGGRARERVPRPLPGQADKAEEAR